MALVKKTTEANEERTSLWVRAEPGMAYELQQEFKLFLSTPKIKEQSTIYKKRIVKICLNLFTNMKSRALAGCLKHTEACNAELQEGDPFEYRNFMVVHGCRNLIVQTLGVFWIGLRFKFSLIWLPLDEY